MAEFHYVIGDIHGCYRELLEIEKQILQHSSRHATNPKIYCVGDYIDRGPKSREVLEHLLQRQNRYFLIAGNHESMMLDALFLLVPEIFDSIPHALFTAAAYANSLFHKKEPLTNHVRSPLLHRGYHLLDHWYSQGGDETARSLFGSTNYSRWNIDRTLLREVARLPLGITPTPEVVITHALVSEEELNIYFRNPPPPFPSNWHDIAYGFLWRRSAPPPLQSYTLHISGHTPLPEPQFLQEGKRLLLDTGCVYGNKLTAFCIETGEFFSVPSTQWW